MSKSTIGLFDRQALRSLLIISFMTVLLVILSPLCSDENKTHATEVILHESCGYNAEFDLYDNGELWIYGTGKVTATNFENITDYFDKLIIEEGITSIGDYVFSDCQNLKSAKLPNSLTSIGENAFFYCKRMTSINLPNNINTIKEYAFYNCAALTKVSIPANVTLIESQIFGSCDSLKTVVIRKNVTRIEDFPFASCDSLTSIHFDGTEKQWNKITNASYVFDLNDALINYNHSNCWDAGVVTKCPTCTATGTKKLRCRVCGATKSVSVPAKGHFWNSGKVILKPTGTTKGKRRFTCSVCGATKTKSIAKLDYVYKGGVLTVYRNTKDYYDRKPPWYKYRNKATKIVIKEGVKRIGGNCFFGFKKFTTVKLPKSLVIIDCDAFDGTSIKSIKLPNNNVRFSSDWFIGNKRFTKFVVPSGHKYYSAYKGVLMNKKKTTVYLYPIGKNSKSLTMPKTVKKIEASAFSDSIYLRRLVLPETTTTIGNYAFDNSSLRTLVIKSKKLTSKTVSDFAFCRCSSSMKIDVPNGKIKKYTKLFRKKGLPKKVKIY